MNGSTATVSWVGESNCPMTTIEHAWAALKDVLAHDEVRRIVWETPGADLSLPSSVVPALHAASHLAACAAYENSLNFTLVHQGGESPTITAASTPPRHIPIEGSAVIVAGGLGGVGAELVAVLRDQGAFPVTLGRGPAGKDVPHIQADLSQVSAERLAAQFDTVAGGRRLAGIVHAAGGAGPLSSVRRKSWEQAFEVLAPKVCGSDELIKFATITSAGFVTFISSLTGSDVSLARGLVDYAAANAYQDGLAATASIDGLVVTSQIWPSWQGVGLAAAEESESIDPKTGRTEFLRHLTAGGSRRVYGREVTGIIQPAASPSDQSVVTIEGVRTAVDDVLGPDVDSLSQVAMDSLVVADLIVALEKHTGRVYKPSEVMAARTVSDLERLDTRTNHVPHTSSASQATGFAEAITSALQERALR